MNIGLRKEGKMGEGKRIAIYLRLSNRDEPAAERGTARESNSIISQRFLLQQYVKENFVHYELQEFCDDGYSGTNFNRPAITRLLEAVKRKAVDCVVVKDFSRFSRDYIELGTYIEYIFPFLEIRFISIGDHYDSMEYRGRALGIEMNFKQLLYDLYSKDLSTKVKAALRTKKENGKYLSANSPFGYQKDPMDRHRLIIKAEEAQVVKKIFMWAVQGYSSVEIAKGLNEEGVWTPMQFRNQGLKQARQPKGGRFEWCNASVCHILSNEVYIGSIVQHKYSRSEVGGRNILNAREDWQVTKNHHEPIIEPEIFESICRRKQSRARKHTRRKHPLSGRCICGGCKKNLQLRTGHTAYYECKYRYTNGNAACVKRMPQECLEQWLLQVLCQEAAKLVPQAKINQIIRAAVNEKIVQLQETQKKLLKEQSYINKVRREDYTRYARQGIGMQAYLERSERSRETGAGITVRLDMLYHSREKLQVLLDMLEKSTVGSFLHFVFSKPSQKLVELFFREVLVTEQKLVVRMNCSRKDA